MKNLPRRVATALVATLLMTGALAATPASADTTWEKVPCEHHWQLVGFGVDGLWSQLPTRLEGVTVRVNARETLTLGTTAVPIPNLPNCSGHVVSEVTIHRPFRPPVRGAVYSTAETTVYSRIGRGFQVCLEDFEVYSLYLDMAESTRTDWRRAAHEALTTGGRCS